MNLFFKRVICMAMIASHLVPSAHAVRVKDLTLVEGGRDNQLVGYGLVVGVAGKGDSRNDQIVRTVANALMRFGLNFFTNGTTLNTNQIAQNPLQSTQLKTENMAAVMVTADIPGFARAGTRIDVTIASMGDAKTIQGAVLLQTPLLGADEQVYAVAQGAIATGGFIGGEGGAGGATVQKNHPTVGMIPGGALVEKEIPSHFVRDNNIELLLLNPDYASAARLAQAINQEFPQSAMAKSAGTVNVAVPEDFKGYEVNFIARMGAVEVDPDVPARVVINERTGTIIATANVRISAVAISHGALTISVAQQGAQVSGTTPVPERSDRRDGMLTDGATTNIRTSTQTTVVEKAGVLRIVEEHPTIQQVASALNALGLTTRDMMSIFQTMKRAGALQAELILN
jgi:flagellar P-ring protein precursor FlgI